MIWRQLFALVSLRIKLSRNQQLKMGKLNFYLSRIMFVVLCTASIGSFLVTSAGGAFLFRKLSIENGYLVWTSASAIFVFYWVLMLLGQLQQTETISFEKLLHMPVSLRGVFLLNYLSSYANSAVVLGAPILFGLVIGLIAAKGRPMWCLLPATIALLLLLTALAYQIRGSVAKLMRNKRLKSLVMILFPCLMLVVFIVMMLDSRSAGSLWDRYFKNEMRDLFRSGPSIPFTTSMFLAALGSLFLSYRSIVHSYVGTDQRKNLQTGKLTNTKQDLRFMYRQIPWASEEASAVTIATLRNFIRSPELFAALVPLLVMIVLGTPYLIGMDGYPMSEWIRPWIPMVIIVVTMLGFPAFLFSMFSYDRDGFRAYVASPMKRGDILLGKNIAIGILTVISGVLPLLAMQFFVRFSTTTFTASVLQVLASYVFLAIMGNFLSVYFPAGLKRGTMQPANAPVFTTILLYAGILCGPMVAIQPGSIACGIAMLVDGSMVTINGWIYLALTILQLIITFVLYYLSLHALDKALWNRQSLIVNTVANLPE